MFVNKEANRNQPCGRGIGRLILVLSISIFIETNAGAYEWTNDYTAYSILGWNDNFRLTEVDPITTRSLDLVVSGELRGDD